MSDASEDGEIENVKFSWGRKLERGGSNKRDMQLYESFTHEGVKYFLYDSVYLFEEGNPTPFIGKLIQIYELPDKARRVKLLWFFHPSEISNYLKGVDVLENELFLATGFGKGLINVNPVEAIVGKCNIVCISKDPRNRQPSTEERNAAQYVFYRTFDVECHTISDILDEKIAAVEVKYLLNKNDSALSDFTNVQSENVAVCEENPLVSMSKGKYIDDRGAFEERTPKKLMLDGITLLLSDGGGPCTHNSPFASVSNKKATQDTATAAVTTDNSDKEKDHRRKSIFYSGNSNDDDWASPTSSSDKRTTEPVKDIHIRAGAVRKLESLSGPLEKRSSKKVKIHDIASSLRDDVGGETQKSATISAAKIEAAQPVHTAVETKDNNKMGKQLAGTSNSIPKMLNPSRMIEDKSVGKLQRSSPKPSLEKYATSSLSKKTSHFQGTGVKISGDRTKLDRGTSHGLPEKPKVYKQVATQVKDNQKSALTFNRSNKALECTKVENIGGANLFKRLEDTKDGVSQLNPGDDLHNNKSNLKIHRLSIKRGKDEKTEAYGHLIEVTQRPTEGSRWMTTSCVPWEQRMKEARDQDTLVLLQNLDPSYTSHEIENIVWHGLKYSCSAKMLPHTAISSPHTGQAFAIFKTSEAAYKTVRKLHEECLMLPNGRPLVGSRGFASFPGKQSSFPGHLSFDKLRHQTSRELREAISTSHFSQPNNLEYDLALDWCMLQKRLSGWWERLYKQQSKQMETLERTLKTKIQKRRTSLG